MYKFTNSYLCMEVENKYHGQWFGSVFVLGFIVMVCILFVFSSSSFGPDVCFSPLFMILVFELQ